MEGPDGPLSLNTAQSTGTHLCRLRWQVLALLVLPSYKNHRFFFSRIEIFQTGSPSSISKESVATKDCDQQHGGRQGLGSMGRSGAFTSSSPAPPSKRPRATPTAEGEAGGSQYNVAGLRSHATRCSPVKPKADHGAQRLPHSAAKPMALEGL